MSEYIQPVVLGPTQNVVIYKQRGGFAPIEHYDFDELIAQHQRCRTQPLQDTGYCSTVDTLRRLLTTKLARIEELEKQLEDCHAIQANRAREE